MSQDDLPHEEAEHRATETLRRLLTTPKHHKLNGADEHVGGRATKKKVSHTLPNRNHTEREDI